MIAADMLRTGNIPVLSQFPQDERRPMIEFPCPRCGTHLQIPRESTGDTALCPTCGSTVPIPESGGAGVVIDVPSAGGAGRGTERDPTHQETPGDLARGRVFRSARPGGGARVFTYEFNRNVPGEPGCCCGMGCFLIGLVFFLALRGCATLFQ